MKKSKDLSIMMLTIMMLLIIVACGGSDDNDDIVEIQGPQVTLNASSLTEYGYFDGMLYYKITSNSTNEVAVVKAESSAIDVTIPNHVIIEGKTYTCTRIEDNVFNGLKRMTSVTIPNSVTYIGSAFSGCSGLTSDIGRASCRERV